ncbi:MAG: Acetyl esterase/lipase [Polaromonas sp.]|nr:Acetyl esterase/lipase [Polaromonas sp.]
MPMPFQAADDYASQVMRWASELHETGMDVHRDVAYGKNRLHRYNVFAPKGAKNAPVVVCWHGGGWTNGYRDYNSFMAPHLTAMGCVLVSPSYRLVAEARLPAAFEDSLEMLGHVVHHIHAMGGDPHRLYLTGHSAGAHLASLVALRTADRGRSGVPDSAVRGCLPVSGIMDLYHPSPAPGSLEERVYGMVLQDPALDAVVSPICWTAGNRVPFALTFGEKDSERVQRSNLRILELLKLQNALADLEVMAGQDHFQTHTSLRDAGHPWYRRLAAMIEAT